MAKTILVVDDEPDIVEMLEETLTEIGYEVITAQDGKDALRKVKLLKPDLLILDVNIPKMDGSQVALELRKNESTKTLPVIFLTGLRSRDDCFGVEKNVGGIPTFAKPFDYEELIGKVRELIEESQKK